MIIEHKMFVQICIRLWTAKRLWQSQALALSLCHTHHTNGLQSSCFWHHLMF